MALHVFMFLLDEVGGRRVALGYVFNRPPSSREALPPPSPLRTARASFPAC